MFVWQRDFLGNPVNLLLSPQKCQGVPFPQSVKIHYFCSGPIGVDPICPQPIDARHGHGKGLVRGLGEDLGRSEHRWRDNCSIE